MDNYERRCVSSLAYKLLYGLDDEDACNIDNELLKTDVEGLVERFNGAYYGYKPILFSEEIENFLNNCKSPKKLVEYVCAARKILEYKKQFDKDADKSSVTGEEIFYDLRSWGPCDISKAELTYNGMRRAFSLAKDIVSGNEYGKQWRFSSKYYSLVEQIRVRRKVYNALDNNREGCKKLSEIINREGDTELGLVQLESEYHDRQYLRIVSKKEMELHKLIDVPFGGIDSKRVRAFYSINEINNQFQLNKIAKEKERRDYLKKIADPYESGYILEKGDNPRAIITDRIYLLNQGIDPDAIGLCPLKLNLKPGFLALWYLESIKTLEQDGTWLGNKVGTILTLSRK